MSSAVYGQTSLQSALQLKLDEWQKAAWVTYGHSGFFPGYMTDMMYFREQKIAVAVQVNTSGGRSLGKPLSRVLIEMMEVIRTYPK